ncbi:adaptor related protein complex 3 subunit sigma 2 [Rhinolophus ferrumequinum]|uniref:Adaptor related protein complex 3 subunit sigma 2 n=1 Tax=Rhinolophus ferrumequinum TaxID=59479 RepID=A0A7J7RAG8_RHIFE|nr:adaptor related protein complex 3 subunit sigma 2 [Rhinolophus ferrumequinum]
MIQAIMVFNNHGKPRLVRFYQRFGGLSAAPARAVSAVKNINLPEIPRNINIGDLNIKVPNLSQFV